MRRMHLRSAGLYGKDSMSVSVCRVIKPRGVYRLHLLHMYFLYYALEWRPGAPLRVAAAGTVESRLARLNTSFPHSNPLPIRSASCARSRTTIMQNRTAWPHTKLPDLPREVLKRCTSLDSMIICLRMARPHPRLVHPLLVHSHTTFVHRVPVQLLVELSGHG